MSSPDFPLQPQAFTGQCRVAEAGACFDWLRQGWAIFMTAPGLWLALTVLFLLMTLLPSVVPFVGQAAAWLLTPILWAGMLAACRRSSQDGAPLLEDLFAGFRSEASGLVILGALYMGAFLALLLLLVLIGGGSLLGGMMLPSMGMGVGMGVAMGGMALLLLLALALLIPVTMAFWFAPAMVLFHRMAPVAALQASFHACAKNWLSYSVFGLLLSIMLFFAILPLGLGLLVLIPVSFGAAYASYRDIFITT